MSKSLGNGVMVGPFVREQSADIARITMLFAAPPENEMVWTEEGVQGAWRYLNRVWRRVAEDREALLQTSESFEPSALEGADRELYHKLHQTLQRVQDDLEELHFNTAIAALMELLNALYEYRKREPVRPVYRRAIRDYLRMLAPFAPHLAEELWHWFADQSVFEAGWPELDPSALVQDSFELVVQVSGRVRGRTRIPQGLSEEEVKRIARTLPNVQLHLQGKRILKEIYVQGKLLNIVVEG